MLSETKLPPIDAEPSYPVGGKPLAIRRQRVACVDGGQRRGDPARLERVGGVGAPADLTQPELLARLDDRLAHRRLVVPGAEELPAGLTGHAVAQRANGLARDRHLRHAEERELGRRTAEQLLDHLHRVRALHLEAVRPAAPVRAERPALVELHLHVVPAGLGVIRDPVQRRRATDEVEPILLEVEEDHVADHVAVRRTGHEVLRPVDAEAVEAVDREMGQQLQGVRALHRQVGHVVRLVVEDARLLPGELLVAPVRELRRHAGVDVRPGLRVAE